MSNPKAFLKADCDTKSITSAMTAAKRSIRVILIQPPTTQGVRSLLTHVDNEGGEGIGFKPPLGVLYIGTMIKQHSEHTVKVIDALAEQLSFKDIVKQCVDFQPDVVGISAWTDFWYPAYRTGQLLKEALPHLHLNYGGPHVSIYPQKTLDVPFVDSVIVGDGEIPFLYLCNLVANEVKDNGLPGLHFKTDGVKEGSGTFYIHKDLDQLPMPDRTLLPIKNYGSILGQGQLLTTMITSRGCPYKCTFCKLNFQKNLAHSAANVFAEFQQIHALGIREIEIYDDTFTWSIERLRQLCNLLIAADLNIVWAVRDRVSARSVDPDLLSLMYQAGCRRIHYGIESGEQRILDRMKKRITLDQARKAVTLAKQAKLTVLTYFMIGNLDETEEDVHKTIQFALKLDADFTQFSITIPYAGTEMYEEALASGIIDHDYWNDYAEHPVPDFLPPQLIENRIDRSTLFRLHDEAVRRYYLRVGFLLRKLLELRSFSEFLSKAKMGIQLCKGAIFNRDKTNNRSSDKHVD